MYQCDICGREIPKKNRLGGYTLCSKHMHQLHKHGKFLDSNPRTTKDMNAFRVEGDTAVFDLYNIRNEKAGEFIIDRADLEKVRYHKWRFTHNHVVTGQPALKQQRELSHVVLGIDRIEKPYVVDHIDCDPCNNRRSNLRICTQGENVRNQSRSTANTSGFTGVSYSEQRNRWEPEIRVNGQRCHLGRYRTMEEAVYARLKAEQALFGEFANLEQMEQKTQLTQNLDQKRKNEIFNYVTTKLEKKNLGNQLRGST